MATTYRYAQPRYALGANTDANGSAAATPTVTPTLGINFIIWTV
jgi:hypothetical protein